MKNIRQSNSIFWLIVITICLGACLNSSTKPDNRDDKSDKAVANIISVQVSGEANAYQFSVGISSPDSGCQQYADWWEVLSGNDDLLYRRILAHSHVNEQPFVRSGGPVSIEENDTVYVRAHMNPQGYGGTVFKGTVQYGFKEVIVGSDFALGVEAEPPQPEGCAF